MLVIYCQYIVYAISDKILQKKVMFIKNFGFLPSGVYFVIDKKVTYIFLKRPKMAFRGKILKI